MTDRAKPGAHAPEEKRESAVYRQADTVERETGPGGDGPVLISQFYTYRLYKLSTLLSRQMHDELKARYRLGLAEWRTIAVLGEFGPLSLRDVSRRGAIDKAQVSRLLPGLIDRDYVVRDPHPTDRRRASLHLTDTGRKLYEEIRIVGRQRQAWLVEELTDEERAMLVGSLDRLLARIETEPAGPFARNKEPG